MRWNELSSFCVDAAPRRRRLAGLLLTTCLALAAGCDEVAETTGGLTGGSSSAAGSALTDPQEVLSRMSRAYYHAPTYADSGQVRLRYLQGTEPVDVSADFSVAFARPNKLRMHVYQAIMVSDGDKLHATIADLPQQVLHVDAPPELTLEGVYSHELLNFVLTNGIAGGSIQIALLLDADALAAITQDASEPTMLESASIGGQRCYRVQLARADGTAVFWIDQQSYELRRFEYPTDALKNHLASGGGVADVSLVADFHGARLGGPIDEVAFDFEASAGAKLVETFVHRPQIARPMPPSELLGKPAPAFSFTSLQGAAFTRQSLAGKIVVLDFWFTTCPPCQVSMPHLEQVYQKYAQDKRVEFLAVSVDDPSVDDEQLRRTLADWGVTIPIVRDKTGFAQDGFQIPGAPSMFVLGPDGRVQDSEVGVNPALVDDLSETLDRLLAGEDTILLARQRYEARLAAYKQSQEEAAAADGASPVARPEIARRSEPAVLRLAPLWKCVEFSKPGNMLVYRAADGSTRIAVVDGVDQIVELDGQGQVTARRPLALPDGGAVSFLRTGVDGDGVRLFAGSASAGRQLYLYDDQWRRVLSYPSDSTSTVADVQLADLDGDKALEIIVGLWGAGGVHCISPAGETRWDNGSLENVYRLAVTSPNAQGGRGLLATNGQGNLVPIDAGGRHATGVYVGGRYLTMIFSGDLDGDGTAEYCGLSRNQAGVETAVGVGHDLAEQWNYPLPFGVHQHPIEPVTFGPLLSGSVSQWVLAGADGSIHILTADGRPLDMFHYGAELTGLAVAEIERKPVLLVATPTSVDAWLVQPPAVP